MNEELVDLLKELIKSNYAIVGSLDNITLLQSNVAESERKQIGYTFEEYATIWVERYKEPKCKTSYIISLKMYLSKYLIPAFGKLYLVDITTDMLQEYVIGIKSAKTRTLLASILCDMLNKAVALQYISFNPFSAVEFVRYEPPRLGAMTHKEQIELLNELHKRATEKGATAFIKDMYIVALILLETGLRPGELLALTNKSIDYTKGEIYVKASYCRKTYEIVKPKTKSGVRIVPVCEPLLSQIKRFARGKKDRIVEHNADSLTRYFRRVFKDLKMDYTLYILRHTFITNAYELGIPDYIVQRWVGHSKREMANTYLGLRNTDDYIDTDIMSYMKSLKSKIVK